MTHKNSDVETRRKHESRNTNGTFILPQDLIITLKIQRRFLVDLQFLTYMYILLIIFIIYIILSLFFISAYIENIRLCDLCLYNVKFYFIHSIIIADIQDNVHIKRKYYLIKVQQ